MPPSVWRRKVKNVLVRAVNNPGGRPWTRGHFHRGGGGEGYASSQHLLLKIRPNRHGLIAGATGTGQDRDAAESWPRVFSAQGVPVFPVRREGRSRRSRAAGRADHKLHEAFLSRAATIGFDDFAYAAAPVTFWDLYGQKGHPVRTTISEMGPPPAGAPAGTAPRHRKGC